MARKPLVWAAFAVLFVVGVGLWRRQAALSRRPVDETPIAVVSPRSKAPGVAGRNPALAKLAAEIPADAISPIARDLNSPTGDIHRDLAILNEVFVAWETNFPHDGNPVGENNEITAALAGDNRLRFAFVAPNHPAIDEQGELCDRWGTPFRFHQLSGTQMEIRSAGPDRKFGTSDDVEFAPWEKQQ